jgi:hypothetical protein
MGFRFMKSVMPLMKEEMHSRDESASSLFPPIWEPTTLLCLP